MADEHFDPPNPFPATFEIVKLDLIEIPTGKYQRGDEDPSTPAKDRMRAKRWDWRLYDPIKIYRHQNRYECYEGGGRTRSARLLGLSELPAFIYDLTDKEAAGVFVRQPDDRRNTTRFDVLKAALFAGDELALSINHSVQEAGYKFATINSKRVDGIRAVGSVYRIVQQYGEDHLTTTLEFSHHWKGDPKVSDGAFLSGLATFLFHYGDRLNKESIENLRQIPVNRFLEEAKGSQQKTRTSKVAAQLREVARVRKLVKAPF